MKRPPDALPATNQTVRWTLMPSKLSSSGNCKCNMSGFFFMPYISYICPFLQWCSHKRGSSTAYLSVCGLQPPNMRNSGFQVRLRGANHSAWHILHGLQPEHTLHLPRLTIISQTSRKISTNADESRVLKRAEACVGYCSRGSRHVPS